MKTDEILAKNEGLTQMKIFHRAEKKKEDHELKLCQRTADSLSRVQSIKNQRPGALIARFTQ
jgi:hypothetical protein